MQVIKIDEQGFVIGIEHINQDEQVDFNYVSVSPPQTPSFFKAKWDGKKWVEGKPQEEIDFEQLLKSLQPTQQNLDAADLEIKILTLLLEMEVI